MGELGARRGAHVAPPANRAQLIEQIEAIRPQMEAFKAKLTEIYAQFDHDMDSVLTDEQKAAYETHFKQGRSFAPPPDVAANDKPLSDEQIERLMQRPFRTLAFFVVVPMTLDRMTTDLKLDDAQREKVRDFLRVRREKFIELADSSPPLSLMLSRLAPVVQRLREPAAPAAAPAK
jgi:Spy/CpxP family protein refolding chaperone